jgi:SAM-dependent methyltransferase
MDKKQFYEEIDVTSMSEDDMRRLKKMLDLVKRYRIESLLDVGSIPDMTEYFADALKCKALGVNISEKVIKSYKGGSQNVRFICGDAEIIDFGEKFDLIICGELLEHLQNPDAFIQKIKDHLNEGGHVLITIPNLASLFNRISLLLGWQPRGINPSRKILLNPFTKYDYNWGHISMFTHYSIRKFLEANGLKVVTIKGTYGGHVGERSLSSAIRALMSLRKSFAEQLIILAEKA